METIQDFLEHRNHSADNLTNLNTMCGSFLDFEALFELQTVNASGNVEVGVYKGEVVAVKRLPHIRFLFLTRELKEDLNNVSIRDKQFICGDSSIL